MWLENFKDDGESYMILIVGGAFQGKKQYAMQTLGLSEEDFTDGSTCEPEEIFTAKAVWHFQEYIRRCMQQGQEVGGLAKELKKRNPDVVVLANEMGSGVVPVDTFDRRYREAVGRSCCALAKEAKEVHRVVCGIGMVIKHG